MKMTINYLSSNLHNELLARLAMPLELIVLSLSSLRALFRSDLRLISSWLVMNSINSKILDNLTSLSL